MTSVFVYEYLTGGGLLADAQAAAPSSLLAEGKAMVAALAADFVAAGAETTCLRDRPLASWSPSGCRAADVATPAQHAVAFDRFASEADWTVVIAPEIGGALAERCRRVADVGGRLLGPAADVIKLASDKQATAEFLAAAGIPVPEGTLLPRGVPWPRDFSYPAVWKPLDGAGSQDVVYVRHPDEPQLAPSRQLGRLERFCPGVPASVALLCGPGGLGCVLPACRQRLSDDRRFGYLGGSLPLPPELERRAQTLAKRIRAALSGAFGYVGVDLVLGASADGGDDVAIEVNPRLTTSYIGLRAACEQNLAEAMLEVAQGRELRSPIASHAVAFEANGAVAFERDAADNSQITSCEGKFLATENTEDTEEMG
jgi:predicted ATP-grasp superfamily ATP-dependent carboligase